MSPLGPEGSPANDLHTRFAIRDAPLLYLASRMKKAPRISLSRFFFFFFFSSSAVSRHFSLEYNIRLIVSRVDLISGGRAAIYFVSPKVHVRDAHCRRFRAKKPASLSRYRRRPRIDRSHKKLLVLTRVLVHKDRDWFISFHRGRREMSTLWKCEKNDMRKSGNFPKCKSCRREKREGHYFLPVIPQK